MHFFKNVCFYFLLTVTNVAWSQNNTVRINEIMANNESVIIDSEGDYSDWIEIYNPTNSSINIEGWSLTDNKNNKSKWIFPSLVVDANKYIVVFASGKDKVFINNEIHTNFKLSSSGEYLGLYDKNGQVITELVPTFPVLDEDQSYGLSNETWFYFNEPSTRAKNIADLNAELPAPEFSNEHGFYDQAFELSLNSEGGRSYIYYTTDGSEPSKQNGIWYHGPIIINSTTNIRAKVIITNGPSSKTVTKTYLFANDIIHQNNSPEGYPEYWGKYVSLSGNAIADYEMDPELTSDPVMAQRVKNALHSLPVVSLVSDRGNFFSTIEDEETGGIYVFSGPPGKPVGFGWERPVSFEYFGIDDSLSFQVDCGIRLHGGHSRRPEKSPKHGFRLVFKSEYGPSKLEYKFFDDSPLESFNSMVLRGGFGNEWIHWSSSERKRGQLTRDPWSKDTQKEMGHLAASNKHVHLFINGIYWGIYNPCERVNADFAESYLGGDSEDYDVIKDETEVDSGEIDAWDKMISLANKGLKNDDDYQYIQGNNPDGSKNFELESYVNVDNLIDYMLLNFYGGNTDWDHHNWVAIRNRVNPGKGYQFFAWDQEHVLKTINGNVTTENNNNCPSNVFSKLKKNEAFKRRFANRVVELCTENGVLTPERNIERWMTRSRIIEKAIDAEAARWGDYRRDVHPYSTGDTYDLYDKDNYWIPERDYLVNDYFPRRTAILIKQLQNEGLYPKAEAPVFTLNGEFISSRYAEVGDDFEISSDGGMVYYTLDGSDPLEWDGANPKITSEARTYHAKIEVEGSVVVCGRTIKNGEWSALRKQALIVKSDFDQLKMTEINYNPSESDDNSNDGLEFIELKNTGLFTLDLEGFKFVNGIDYVFPKNSVINPGQFIVLAANDTLLYNEYNYTAFDVFNGQLDNSGERITLISSESDTLISIKYNDKKGWPIKADGNGKTLVPVDLNPINSQENSSDWRQSHYEGGSPGTDDLLKADNNTYPIATNEIRINQYPNPFSEKYYIDYQILEAAFVEVEVFNLMGEVVSVLEKGNKEAGFYQACWDGTSESNVKVAKGLYFYRMHVKSANSNQQIVRKLIYQPGLN